MIKVRAVIEDDFGPWAKMRAVLWPSESAQAHLNELREFVTQDTFKAWVAVEDGKYAGFAEASIRPFANGCDSRPVVFLEGIWVAEEFRKTGVGHQFVNAVEEWARALGINEIGSDAELSNELSHSGHKKWGFEETERVVYFRKKLLKD